MDKPTVQQKLEQRKLKPVNPAAFRFMVGLATVLFKKKYNVHFTCVDDITPYHGKPYIVVSNHASRMDYVFTAPGFWPDTFNFVVGYKQGALYANPDGTVLDPVYTDDYEAPDKGKEAALSLYSQGADVVYAVAGKTGLGVFEAAQEQGKYAVGVDSDQKYINPDVIICSMLKRVGDSVYDVISNYLEDGVFDGGTIWNADMSSGLVGLGYGDDTMTQQVSDELKAEVEALAEKIIAGEIEVESTR